jgi:hypothetical protein
MFDAHAQAIDRCILEVQIVGEGAEPRLDQRQAARIFQRSYRGEERETTFLSGYYAARDAPPDLLYGGSLV